MSATLSSTEQKVYNKVMASKKKAMTLAQIEAAIPGLSKKEMNASINNILRLKLFTAMKNKDDVLIFNAVAVEDAKRQNTLTEEQQFVLSIIEKAGNKGISRSAIANQVSAELMARSQVFKSLEALEKNQLIKTFKSVNAPTMPLYILAHLKPPEDIAGGVWFDESKEYDSVFVDSLRMVVFKYVQHKTFPPQKKDAISSLCSNPINPIAKTPSLPTPQELLRHILSNKVTSAKLTVKNVMEIARALELDGMIEAIKPVGGVSVEPQYDSDSDGEPVQKRRRNRAGSDDDLDPAERSRRERKEKEKLKAKMKERKREQHRKERAKEKERERERERKKKEKEKARKKKEKERKKKEKEKERKRKEKEKGKKKKRVVVSDDDSDDELREIGDDEKKSKRKRRAAASDSDGSDSDSDISSSDSDSTSDSDSSTGSDDDSDVSSIMSDDIDDGDVGFKPKSGGGVVGGISSNPFFSADGRQTLIDLSDQAVVYRATRRLQIPLGEMQAPCGTCPQFSFCEEAGPVNPGSCSYFSDWLAGTNGGWTADVKAEKAKQAAEADKARRLAQAEANGETLEEANGDEGAGEDAAASGDENAYGGYDDEGKGADDTEW